MTTGYLVRENATDITDPVPNETVVLQTTTVGGRTAGQLYLWNGAAWVALTGSGTGVPAGPITTSGLTQATGKLLGRSTALTGAIEEITVGSNLTLAAGTLSASGGGGGSPVSYPFAEWTQQTGNATQVAGDFTVGQNFLAMQASVITALQFPFSGFASKTVKWAIYDTGYLNTGTTQLATGTVAVSAAQVYTATFGSPITFTVGKSYTVTIYVNDGSNFLKSNTTFPGFTGGPNFQLHPVGPVFYRSLTFAIAGDNQPTVGNDTHYIPITLVYQ